MSDDKFNDFNLIGGTALALKLGHRISIDIDLFSTTSFNTPALASHLTTAYNAIEVRMLTNGVFCFVDDIKIDLISHQYPLVDEIDTEEGIRMVSLQDIGAMKLNAIYNNGTRLKDFVDMYTLLEVFSLEQLMRACHQKYSDIDIRMVKNTLIHFGDIDFSIPIQYTGQEITWPQIAGRLQKAFQLPNKTFDLPNITKKLMENQKSKDKGKKQRYYPLVSNVASLKCLFCHNSPNRSCYIGDDKRLGC